MFGYSSRFSRLLHRRSNNRWKQRYTVEYSAGQARHTGWHALGNARKKTSFHQHWKVQDNFCVNRACMWNATRTRSALSLPMCHLPINARARVPIEAVRKMMWKKKQGVWYIHLVRHWLEIEIARQASNTATKASLASTAVAAAAVVCNCARIHEFEDGHPLASESPVREPALQCLGY